MTMNHFLSSCLASAVIVEIESNALLPANMVGEIWLSCDSMFPTELWALKKLSDKLLQAKANLYTYKDNTFTRKSFPGM